jgi:phosphatidylinositol glycan class V
VFSETQADLIARLAACLFAINPAGIFFSALYSESLFSLLSFGGMYLIERAARLAVPNAPVPNAPASRRGRPLLLLLGGALCFALATACRSNGIVLALLLLHAGLRVRNHWRTGRKDRDPSLRWLFVPALLLLVALVTLPYVALQFHGYFLYCAPAPTAVQSLASRWFGVVYPELPLHPDRPWCGVPAAATGSIASFSAALTRLLSVVPPFYSYLQTTYWDVGFLRYIAAPKHIPDVLLAAPMLLFAAHAIAMTLCGRFLYMSFPSWRKKQPQGEGASKDTGTVAALLVSPVIRENLALVSRTLFGGAASLPSKRVVLSTVLTPYVLHWWGFSLVALLFMHVQVVTRFVAAACPALYWYLAYAILMHATHVRPAGDQVNSKQSAQASPFFILVVLFAVGYSIVGSVLFSAYLPWT